MREAKAGNEEMQGTEDRTAEDCRSKIKRLKVTYFNEKRRQRSGEGVDGKFKYYEEMGITLGTRLISDLKASFSSHENGA